MNVEALNLAIFEAKRFLLTAQAVRTEPGRYGPNKQRLYVVNNTKEAAACKRASLDLSRSLSELRKP